MGDPLGPPASASLDWWLIADQIWAGPGRWLRGHGLAMRGPVAAGGDPVPVAQIPPTARRREFGDLVLPGLQDAHVHSGLVDLRAARAAGIAAVTDLGAVPEQVTALRAESRQFSSGLPMIQFAGAFLTAPGGYPSDRSWAAPGSWRTVRSVEDAGTAVAEQAAIGAVAVKVTMNETAGPLLAPPVLAAVVAAAHAAGLRVVAHVEGEGTVDAALAAGVDVFAHTPWTETLDAARLRACAEQTVWISSLRIHERSPSAEVARANLAGFLAAGGTVRFGTDLGNGTRPPDWINAEEVKALFWTGMSVDDVLAAMTGPMLGSDHERSRFGAGGAVSYLGHPLAPDEKDFGPQIRSARVLDLADIQDMEK